MSPSTSVSPAPAAHCPLCDGTELDVFYRVAGVPTNSCLILESEAAARALPKGDIELAFCSDCGFVHNRAFDPTLTEYSDRYVSTQAHSPTFAVYQRTLAHRIGEHFGPHGGRVLEIGCGAGEFVHLLAELLDVEAIGIDPAATAGPGAPLPRSARVRLLSRFFDETAADELEADVVVCKMTLEHVPAVEPFAAALAHLAGNRPGLGLFLQVPDAERVLRQEAFWDIYYEHCNYFTAATLRALAERHGFGDVTVTTDYGDQYLDLFARHGGPIHPPQGGPAAFVTLVERFRRAVPATIAAWSEEIDRRTACGRKLVLWGSGSKAVAFLGVLPNSDRIDAVVDINPARQGQFVAGTAHPVIAPEELRSRRPHTVVVMNPNYVAEISAALAELDCAADVLALS